MMEKIFIAYVYEKNTLLKVCYYYYQIKRENTTNKKIIFLFDLLWNSRGEGELKSFLNQLISLVSRLLQISIINKLEINWMQKLKCKEEYRDVYWFGSSVWCLF